MTQANVFSVELSPQSEAGDDCFAAKQSLLFSSLLFVVVNVAVACGGGRHRRSRRCESKRGERHEYQHSAGERLIGGALMASFLSFGPFTPDVC